MEDEPIETEIQSENLDMQDIPFNVEESQANEIVDQYYEIESQPQTADTIELASSNEELADLLNAQGAAEEGKQYEATPKAEEELTYKIDEREYIVTVDENGKEKAIPSSNDAKLREIVDELKANGHYLRFDTVEELGTGKAEQTNEQSAEKVEAGTRFGTLYVLNRADMTFKIYTVKEVKIPEPEQQPANSLEDDGDDEQAARPDIFNFGNKETEEEKGTPELSPSPIAQEAINAEMLADLMDYDDPTEEVVTQKNEFQPIVIESVKAEATNIKQSEQTEIAVTEPAIELAEDVTPIIEYNLGMDEYDYGIDDVVQVSTETYTRALSEPTTEVRAVAPEDNQEKAQDKNQYKEIFDLGIKINYGSSEPVITYSIPQPSEIIELGNIDQNPEVANEDIEQEASEETLTANESPIRIERFVVTDDSLVQMGEEPVVIAKAEFNYFESASNESSDVSETAVEQNEIADTEQQAAEVIVDQKTSVETEIVTDEAETSEIVEAEPISLVIENVSETVSEKSETVKKAETNEETKPEVVTQTKLEPQAIKIETRQEESRQKSIEQPVVVQQQEIKAATKLQVETPKLEAVREPIKIVEQKPVERPEAIRIIEAKPLERQDTVKPILNKEPVMKQESVVKSAAEVKEQKVEAPKPTLEQKVIQPEPIAILTNYYETTKAAPTRSETNVNVKTTDASRTTNNSTMKSSVISQATRQEGLRPSGSKTTVTKILDELEKNNYNQTAQQTGIKIAAIAR